MVRPREVALLVWGVLLALEVLFWIPPASTGWQRVKRRLYKEHDRRFFALPAEYLVRLTAVAIVLTATGAWGSHITWSALVGASWKAAIASAISGVILGLITTAILSAQRMASWRQLASGILRRWDHALYILFWVSGVEEFLFRAVLISLWAPSAGAWAILLSVIANMVWHVPVWLVYASQQGMQFRQMILGGSGAALCCSVIYYTTGSLLGPIIAHFASDMVNLVSDNEKSSTG